MKRIKVFFGEIRGIFSDLRQGYWSCGFQWPPKFMVGRIYYDWWWYYLHLGPFWIGVAPIPPAK